MGWKIVRDKQQEYCLQHGVSGQWRASPHPAMALMKKLSEEYGELVETMDPGELYDLLDVAWKLVNILDSDGKHRVLHQHKVARMGGFSQLTEWTPIPAGGEHSKEGGM